MNKLLIFSLIAGLSLGAKAIAQSVGSYELMCRAKAKEIAADTYRNCVTENRNSEVEKLKKDYQERLRSLKDDYEKEIDKLGGKASVKKSNAQKMTADNKTNSPANSGTMDVAIHPVNREPLADDSRMDLPEPIPVENIDKN